MACKKCASFREESLGIIKDFLTSSVPIDSHEGIYLAELLKRADDLLVSEKVWDEKPDPTPRILG